MMHAPAIYLAITLTLVSLVRIRAGHRASASWAAIAALLVVIDAFVVTAFVAALAAAALLLAALAIVTERLPRETSSHDRGS